MTYDVDYFINKFSNIPEELWLVFRRTDGTGRCCALGHINEHPINSYCEEEQALHELMPFRFLTDDHYHNSPAVGVAPTNNGTNPHYQQPTPKQRILAALYDIKKLQQPEVKERIVYVTIDEKVRDLQMAKLSEQ